MRVRIMLENAASWIDMDCPCRIRDKVVIDHDRIEFNGGVNVKNAQCHDLVIPACVCRTMSIVLPWLTLSSSLIIPLSPAPLPLNYIAHCETVLIPNSMLCKIPIAILEAPRHDRGTINYRRERELCGAQWLLSTMSLVTLRTSVLSCTSILSNSFQNLSCVAVPSSTYVVASLNLCQSSPACVVTYLFPSHLSNCRRHLCSSSYPDF